MVKIAQYQESFDGIPGQIVASANGDNRLQAAAEINDEELEEIGIILSLRRHFDLSVYKPKCMKRRVAIRMRSTRCLDVSEYCNLLRQDERELDLLQKTLTIHVSQFFRNPTLFEKLRTEIIPELFKTGEKDASGPLRFWCLGCAGGEEPYSLAILLREYFGREILQTRVEIVGTDIDDATLETAGRAEFNEDRLADVPMEIRERYFRQRGTRFRLNPEIRDMVTFSRGDMINVAGYIHSNVVLCRNALIYFTRSDQEKILNGIADILPIGGILALGKSETLVGASRQRFVTVCPVERIYRRV